MSRAAKIVAAEFCAAVLAAFGVAAASVTVFGWAALWWSAPVLAGLVIWIGAHLVEFWWAARAAAQISGGGR